MVLDGIQLNRADSSYYPVPEIWDYFLDIKDGERKTPIHLPQPLLNLAWLGGNTKEATFRIDIASESPEAPHQLRFSGASEEDLKKQHWFPYATITIDNMPEEHKVYA